MRFTLAAASLLAVVAAESTVYSTDVITVVSCAASVTNCPARSTVVSTTSYPVVLPTSIPAYVNTTASVPSYPVSSPAGVASYPVSSYPAVPTSYPAVAISSAGGVPTYPAVSLSTMTISTCVPTVIYSTVTVPTASASVSGVPSPSTNGTFPVGTATPPPFPNSAAGIQASFGLAAVAAIAAFLA